MPDEFGIGFTILSLTVIFGVVLSAPAYALLTLNTGLSASEMYTDNLFFTDGNEEEEFGTFISPRLTLTYQNPDIIISGTYIGTAQFFVNNPNANRYAQFSNFNISLPFLTKRIENLEVQLIESFNFSPQLQAFSFAGEPGEETALTSLQQGLGISGLSRGGGVGISGLGGGLGGLGGGIGGIGGAGGIGGVGGGIGGVGGFGGGIGGPSLSNQGVFTRRSDAFQNLSGVNLRYLWSARFSTTLGYRNRLTLFTSDAFQDTMVHTVNVGTAYALAPTTDVRMTYGVSISDFIGGQAQNTGIQGGGSFTTHSGTIGLSHRFSPTLASSAQVGMAVTNSRMNFIANASLAKQFQRTTLSVGYRQNVTSGGGLAASATLTQSFVGTLNHMLTNRLAAFAQGGVSRSESLSGSVIDVMAYQARTGVSYLILSWLSGSASYSYIFQDSSGTAGNDAQVNQVFVTLTAFAPPWRILE